MDFDSAPHTNPEVETVPLPILELYNGKEISSSHMHLYVEGFGEKWAVPAELLLPLDGKDIYEIMEDFFRYCNVKQQPRITKTLLI